MNKRVKLGMSLMCLASIFGGATLSAKTPILFFHTSLYENVGEDNAFHFSIGAKSKTNIEVDFGFGPETYEVNPAVFNSSSGQVDATVIAGSVSQSGNVKIYGDASLIDYLDMEGVYANTITMPTLTQLEILNLKHNELQALDLSGFNNLQAIYLSDNPFDVSPLIIGPNKPDLTILEISNIGALNQSFNLSDYPSMKSFDAYATHSLRTLDPSGCPGLLKLSIDCTSVMNLNLSNNPRLIILNVSETGITDLDLSHVPNLEELYCTHTGGWMSYYQLTSLDLSSVPKLKRLMCQGNLLTSLDVSVTPLLTDLYCNANRLQTIDISGNPDILNLNISRNQMDFKTMPLPRESFIEYYYYQDPMPVERSYPEGAVIDMSERVIIPDSYTGCALFARKFTDTGEPISEPLPADFYSYSDGKVTLLKASTDSLYMVFANSKFPLYNLESSNFMVKTAADYGKDNPTIKLRVRPGTSSIAFRVGLAGASPQNPKRFAVDFGDGNPVDFTADTQDLPGIPNAEGSVLRTGSMVIYVPEGEDLISFGIENVPLTSFNTDLAPVLSNLKVTGCSLNSINLGRNAMLTSLDLSNNNLTTFDLEGSSYLYTKNLLKSINLSDNKLTAVTPGLGSIKYADLSKNKLESMNLLKANDIEYLDLSDNFLTEVDLRDLESVSTLNLSGNYLSDLIIQNYLPLENLDIRMNVFPLSTLPAQPAPEYLYAPQRQWEMPEKAPTADLTMQLLNSPAGATVFTWFRQDGSPVPGGAIIESEPGVFQLNDVSLGKIYCTIYNPAFPELSGANLYRTTDIEVVEKPNVVVCSFKTLAEGIGELVLRAVEPATAIYVDWEDNGNLKQYIVGTTPVSNSIKVKRNKEVKVYAYSPQCGIDVFSMAAGTLESIDASPLGQLVNFSLYGSKLSQDKMKLPLSDSLKELVINGASITDPSALTTYTALKYLNLSANNLTDFDAAPWQSLEVLYLSGNRLSSVNLSNPLLWELSLNENNLEQLDLSGLPALLQAWLFGNNLRSLNILGLNNLNILEISDNCFDFTTLPEVMTDMYMYAYGNQKNVVAALEGDKVDLSACGAEEYTWFDGSPGYDEEAGVWYGSQLRKGTDYLLEDGVTTFLRDVRSAVCLMKNQSFPDLDLFTDPIKVNISGVEQIISDAEKQDVIYDLLGRKVTDPENGVYIVNGKKKVIK